MMHCRRFAWPLMLAGFLALVLVAAGCEDDESSDSGASSASRSDTELTALADEAAADSGINSFNEITEANASEVGDAGASGSGASGQDSEPTFTGLQAAPGAAPAATAARALANALSAAGRAGGWLERAGSGVNAVTVTETIDDEGDCPSSGTVTVTGTVTTTGPDNSASTSGTVTVTIDDLDIIFEACSDGATQFWGQLRLNSGDSLAYALSEAEDDITIDFTFDEYLDAGLVVLEVSTDDAYNFTLRESLVGSLAGSFHTGYDTVDLTATLTIVDNTTGDGYSCTATATSVDEIETVDYTCTAI